MSGAGWWREITPVQWRALGAAQGGWMLDAMDVMLYTFALTQIRAEFGLSGAAAGALAAATLLASAAGGIVFGYLADRIGRARALIWSILIYSVATALCATSQSVAELVLWRTILGIGLGGEWSAGSVLVAETWPDAHRGKAIGIMQSGWALGYLAAALLAALVLPAFGWRALFALGILPALLVVWVRRRVAEPERWRDRERVQMHVGEAVRQLASPALRRRVLVASLLAASVLFAYWGLFTWLPAYLGSPRAAGGAGLSLVKTSGWMVPVQLGAFAGYLSFGFFADRFGRKRTFVVFVLAAAALVPIYGSAGNFPRLLLALGLLVGFFGHGYFSVFGALLAELFPLGVRGTAQGFCYNVGRATSAFAPIIIGSLADTHGIGAALALTSAFFVLGAIVIRFLPETRQAALS